MYSRRTTRYGRRNTGSIRVPAAPSRELPPEMMRRIDADPSFQVMTLDLQQWIDPYTGKAVPASLGRAQAAREYLLENDQLWKTQEPLPLGRLEFERWRIDLIRLLPVEPRLRMFGRDGTWLNPYTGDFVPGLLRDDGKITLHTVSQMAEALCLTPAARGGKLLDPHDLAERARASAGRSTTSVFAKPPAVDDAMEKARSVQRNMLPELPRLDGFELAVHYKAHHGVSGDFYDVLTLPDGRVLLAVGDVTGHGMQAALVVATALKTLRFVARQAGDLVDLLARFNDEIKSDLLPGQFITLFAAALDARTGEVSCVRAGHHPALVVNMRQEAILRRAGRSGMAIGLASGWTFAATLREESLSLLPGDVLVQYTDGLIEAQAADERQYGEHRLYGSVLQHLEDGPQGLVDGIAEDASRWANGPVGDDVTILALVAHAPRAAVPLSEPSSTFAAEGGTAEMGVDEHAPGSEEAAPTDAPPAGESALAAGPAEAVADSPAAGPAIVGPGDELQPHETGELQAPATA